MMGASSIGDKAKAEDKTAVEEKIKALKEVKDKDNMDALKKAMDELSNAIQKVGAAMYSASAEATADKEGASGSADQQSADQPGANPSADQNAGPSTGSGPTAGTVDADYKEVPKQ